MTTKGGSKIEVSDYTMTIHTGVCAYTEGLELLAVKYGEKEIWRGSAVNQGVFAIHKPDLFGGPKKEGGVSGLMWWLPGKPDQVLPESLATKFGLTPSTSPGYRGFASLFFTGVRDVVESEALALAAEAGIGGFINKKGFYWGSNNPYLRNLSVRVRRPSTGLESTIALIRIPDDSNGNEQWASNPAHMIYECLTNTDWGMGESPAAIDVTSLEEGAQTLFDENFCLSMLWARQSEVGKFVGEILTHIRGAVFVSPRTGKHTLKLLRADYDPETVPEINPSNARLSSFKRKVWGEIANEVVVTYTNSETGKDQTVTAQDLAGIAAEGGIISSSQNYYGIPHEALAVAVAERDLASSVAPIAVCEAVVSREFWASVTNDVVRLSWPEYDIAQIIFRVGQVSKSGNAVHLSLYEDVFGLDKASYLSAGDTNWINPSQPPSPASYYQLGTAPAFMMAAALGLDDPGAIVYPEAMSMVTVGADSDDDVNFDVVSYLTDVNGTTSQANLGTRAYNGTWVLLDGLTAEASTLLAELPGLRGRVPSAGQFILIGTDSDDYTEIATVQSVSGAGYLLNRGMLDTVPRAWPAGTRAFVVSASSRPVDATVRAVGEDVSYWLLTRTTIGTLNLADAPQINLTLSDRAHRPNRPANVKVNGVGFGTVDASAAADLTVTWANRNRITESTQALKWGDANVAGEAGQTTTVAVTQPDGTPIVSYTGLTGTSKVISKASLSGHSSVRVLVSSVRDGFTSLQSMGVLVIL